MASLKIEVTGTHNITLAAERAILHLHITSTGPIQSEVSQAVTATSNYLQALLKSLCAKTSSGDTHPDAPITKWTMSTLNTGSPFMFGYKPKSPQPSYTASTDFQVTFRDFAQLGAMATEMSEMAGVQVRRVEWTLTEETKARYASVARQGAVRDALEKARDYATAAGRTTVKAVGIMELHGGGMFGPAASGIFGGMAGTMTMGGGPPEERLTFEPETRDVGCQVKVCFEAE